MWDTAVPACVKEENLHTQAGFSLFPLKLITDTSEQEDTYVNGMDPVYSALDNLINDFYQMSHISTTFYDATTLQPVIHSNDPGNSFCGAFWKYPAIRSRCDQCDRSALQVASHNNRLHCYTCHAGLLECIYPIFYKGTLLGYFMYGQRRTAEDTPENREKRFRLYHDFGLDADEMEKLYQASPIMDEQQLTSVGHIMSTIAQHTFLSCMLGDHNAPLATRIMLYIQLNHRNAIDTNSACAFFNISKSTLQHTIQKDLNSTFVTLLNKQRIESVCHCLQRNTPIAEAAMFSGFPSANYMTRIFRRMTGMTPTQYIALHNAQQDTPLLNN